jgi:hypothetical protein
MNYNVKPVQIGREQLGFLPKAKIAFGFLTEYGYKITKEDTTFLRYEGPLGFINVFHGRMSYEIAFEFGLLGEDTVYHASDLIEITGAIITEDLTTQSAWTPETVEKFIDRPAKILKTYGQRIFDGDITIWDELKKYHTKAVKDYWNGIVAEQVRKKASKAFQEKRYSDFIKIYSDCDFQLTHIENKRLEYARKKINNSNIS